MRRPIGIEGGMRKPLIRLLITDMDNTLYDWVSFYVPALYDMVEVASEILSVSHDQVLDELRSVHQRYHNSEHPFALLEIPSVSQRFPMTSRDERATILDPAFHAFNRARKRRLALYPEVEDSLQCIRSTGARIVAHSEARIWNSLYRFLILDLRRYISCLYAPEGLGLEPPAGRRAELSQAARDLVRRLPSDHRKPDPSVIQDICNDYGLMPRETLYVGDSLTRDIYMAEKAGAWAAWAHYGGKYDKSLWEQLVRVTHWTRSDVEREEGLRAETKGTRPDVELRSFGEILSHFEFRA